MKKPFALIAAIVAVVGFGAVAAVAKETIKVETSVTLSFRSDLSGPKPDSFIGEVNAKKRGCENARTVRLYDDTVVEYLGASDKTNDRGRYKIFIGHAEAGVPYVARARRKKITKDNGDTIVCMPRFSNRVHLP